MNVICNPVCRMAGRVPPGKPKRKDADTVNTVLASPRNRESRPQTVSLPNSSAGKDTGIVRMLFNVSSVPSRLMIYPVIRAIHMGKIVVMFSFITCSAKWENVQTVPSRAVVVKMVSKTARSISKIPAQIMLYRFSFQSSVFIVTSISIAPSLFIQPVDQPNGQHRHHAQNQNRLRGGGNQILQPTHALPDPMANHIPGAPDV